MHAALFNGGPTTFPYSNCDNNLPDAIQISTPTIGSEESPGGIYQYEVLKFSVFSTVEKPLSVKSACVQDIATLQLNSCE